jgi:membrane protein implicated in regulation of membrane protease activity
VRAVLLMYAWTALIAGTAVAIAFVPLGYAAVGFLVGLGLLIFAVRRPGTPTEAGVRPLRTGTDA